MMSDKQQKILTVALLLIGGLLPLIWYAGQGLRTPILKASTAITWLNQPESTGLLVDVRPAEEFTRRHIVGAQNWPQEEIEIWQVLPTEAAGQTLYVLSGDGLARNSAVAHLRALGAQEVYNVRGGLQEWIRALRLPETAVNTRFVTLNTGSPWQPMSLFEQVSAVTAAFVFKPLYMILSGFLILVLWRVRAADLVALRWGLIFFLAGEGFCAFNYIAFNEDSYLAEYLHSFGMVAAFAFVVFALLEGIDSRIVHLSDPEKRCAFLGLCGACIKYKPVRCGANRLLVWSLPLLMVLAFIPLLAQPIQTSYNTTIVDTVYNYAHLGIYQLFELRYLPSGVILLFGVALAFIRRNTHLPIPDASRILLAAGMGALSFSLFRLLFSGVFQNHLIWSTFWEELTELLFVVAVGIILGIFRGRLLYELTPGNQPLTWQHILAFENFKAKGK